MTLKNWTILELINETVLYFEKYGIDNPRLNIERILEEVLKLKRIDLYLNFDRPLQSHELDKIREMVKKRSMRIPLYYILGHAPFLDWEFKVTPQVLIPRPETELLVEKVVSLAKTMNVSSLRILDIGTGSGCIAISLAKLLENAIITAMDNSNEAILIAQENATLLGVCDRIKFVNMDITAGDKKSITGEFFNIIVSNPPYIKHDELESLPQEVKNEPQRALDGGSDGLFFYRKIIEKISFSISSGGYTAFEIGCDQGEGVRSLVKKQIPFASFELFKDDQKLDRIVIIKT